MDGPIDGPLLPWPVGPPPGPGLHQWDGQGAGPIRLIEVMMEAEIERLDGIQNIRNMVHAAWVRLSTAVGPANGYVNVDDQRDAALAVCDSVSILEDIVAPVANGPANLANDRVQKFKFQLSGQLGGVVRAHDAFHVERTSHERPSHDGRDQLRRRARASGDT